MKEFLTTPEGITALCTLLTLVLSVLANVFTSLGWKNAAARAATAGKIAGTVVKGVERAKGKLDRQSATALIETLREENLAADIETLVKPIIEGVRAGTPPEAAVRAATARMDPRRVS